MKTTENGESASVVESMEVGDSDETPEIVPKSPEELAELKKENGNQLYKVKQYKSALPLYSAAIELCPNTAAYYGNRAACYMMLCNYQAALNDARRSVDLDNVFVKGYIRMLKCAIALGDVMTAETSIGKIKELEPDNNAIEAEVNILQFLKQYEGEATKAREKQDFRKIVYCMDRCLSQAPTCNRYKVCKAENLVLLARFSEAQELVTGVLQIDKGNADAIYVRGLCLLYEDQIDSAFNHFTQVLRLAPDHAQAMGAYKHAKLLKKTKEEGNEAYKHGKFQKAYDLYTQALSIDPLNKKTNAKLYFNRALVLSRLTKTQEAIADCTDALKLDEGYIKALTRRASCYMDVGEYESAVADYERLIKLDRSREHKRLLQDAKQALKRSLRKDYYKILGVGRDAGEDDIKRAYKKRAMIHHPDRHASASDEEKKEQEKKFKDVGEAYGVLSDQKKKERYDNGQDLEGAGMDMDFDPNQMFQTFFNFNGGGNACPNGFSFQFG